MYVYILDYKVQCVPRKVFESAVCVQRDRIVYIANHYGIQALIVFRESIKVFVLIFFLPCLNSIIKVTNCYGTTKKSITLQPLTL